MRRVEFSIGTGLDRDGNVLDYIGDRTHSAVTLVAKAFGGCFVTQVRGGWINDNGTLIAETGIAITSDIKLGTIIEIGKIAQQLADVFNQTAVHVTMIDVMGSWNEERV